MSRFDFDALDGVLDGDIEATGTQTVAIPKTPPERPVAARPPPAQRAPLVAGPAPATRPAKAAPRRPWLLVGSAALVLGLAIGWTAGTRIPVSKGTGTTVPLAHPDQADAITAPASTAPAAASQPAPVGTAEPAPAAPSTAQAIVQPPVTSQPTPTPELSAPGSDTPVAVGQADRSGPAAQPGPTTQPEPAKRAPQDAHGAPRRWTIPFGFDSAAAPSAADIAAVATCRGRLEVVGHTDTTGARAYNDALSLRRAEAIGALLESAGISHDRITLRGAGPSDPLVAGTSLQARRTNRRVEIHCAP